MVRIEPILDVAVPPKVQCPTDRVPDEVGRKPAVERCKTAFAAGDVSGDTPGTAQP